MKKIVILTLLTLSLATLSACGHGSVLLPTTSSDTDVNMGGIKQIFDYMHVVSVGGEKVKANVLYDSEYDSPETVHAVVENVPPVIDLRNEAINNGIGMPYAVGLDRFEPTDTYIEFIAPEGSIHDDDILRVRYEEENNEIMYVEIVASNEMEADPYVAESAEKPPADLVGRD